MLQPVATRRARPIGLVLWPLALLLVTSPGLVQTAAGVTIGTIAASPTAIAPGGTVTVTADITNDGTNPASDVNVLLYITDPSGNAFEGNHQVVTHQSFAGGQSRTYAFQWTAPTGVGPGAYSAFIGVFSSDWSTSFAFQPADSPVTIMTGPAPTLAIGRTRAAPGSVPPGEPVTVTTHVTDTSAQPASDIIVLCELNNAADDANIASLVVTGQTFSAGQTRSLAFVLHLPGNMPAGTYSIDIGAFSGDWSTLFAWGFRVATFTVQ
jgi:hypothetical protein